MNGFKLKIIGAILSAVFIASMAVIAWYVDSQADINEKQDSRIEKKVDEKQYIQDIDRIDKKLDKIIEWIIP